MRRVSVGTAGQLLDFTAGGRGPVGEYGATEQLEGAVAIHNILAEHGVAYLADEVGMGKTYVALGTIALLRHFNPSARVLVIAPRENIQKKWLKELRNFVAANVRFPDLRIKGADGRPARAPVFCENLSALLHEALLDPDRDFFARMTSFSVALGRDSESWKRVRDNVVRHVPWVDRDTFDLRSRDRFKDSVGRALNAVLPAIDLVVVDEGHNLKHGLGADASTRNRLMALAFGHPSLAAEGVTWPTYGPRARRVLFLSATPVEDDFTHLWNQLDVFGKGDAFRGLLDRERPDVQRETASRILVRRIFSMRLDGKRLTKNLYRREWRQGGVEQHDDPIAVPGTKQQLVVALVQKKVAELIGSERFNNSFQIGMLASFESFLQTARVARVDEDAPVFEEAEQAQTDEERLGVDVHAVNRLAADYRRKFGEELPHPKMDAVVAELAGSFERGEKALVFVRRVASVSELRRKLNERYDAWVIPAIREALRPELQPAFDRVVAEYGETRRSGRRERPEVADAPDADVIEDSGSQDSFFGWYFRGRTPVPGILSGGQFAIRFNSAGATLGTFFEDNHVGALLEVRPGEVAAALVRATNTDTEQLGDLLRAGAGRRLAAVRKQQRGTVFLAYQAAALSLIAERSPGELAQRARIMLDERFADFPEHSREGAAPTLGDRLETRTFWTALRELPDLRAALWPERVAADFRSLYRERELRRELLSSMARLGHPLIDLYVASTNVLGSLEMGSQQAGDQGSEAEGSLIDAYLALLENQRASGAAWSGFRELEAAAQHFDLILATNEPEARTVPLYEASRMFGRLLRAQEPVGGMSGQVNETLVRQFRMPGYPLVLVTTELLREGEDLHTFCSNVVHYGIAWMPSGMEQRVGRIDRVSSLTERRLSRLARVEPASLLQVQYPHLRETVERMQVERVLRRQQDFLRLLHRGLGSPRGHAAIDVMREATHTMDPFEPLLEPLETAYPVRAAQLQAEERPLAVLPEFAESLAQRFLALRDVLTDLPGEVEWEESPPTGALLGTIRLTTRVQPFTLLLRSLDGLPMIRCISPVGVVDALDEFADELLRSVARPRVRLCASLDEKLESYNLTVEGDVLLAASPRSDGARVGSLISAVTGVADAIEDRHLFTDEPMSTFRDDLRGEVDVNR